MHWLQRRLPLLSGVLSVIVLVSVSVMASPATMAAPSLPTVQGAVSAQCLQPPADADLTALSTTQLAAYGLPRHAQVTSDAQWRLLLQHARHRVCTEIPTKISSTSQESWGNWAGNIG